MDIQGGLNVKTLLQNEVERIEDMDAADSHVMRHGAPTSKMRQKMDQTAATPCPGCGQSRTVKEELLDLNCDNCGH